MFVNTRGVRQHLRCSSTPAMFVNTRGVRQHPGQQSNDGDHFQSKLISPLKHGSTASI